MEGRGKFFGNFRGGGGEETPLVGRRMSPEWGGHWSGGPLPGGAGAGWAVPWGWVDLGAVGPPLPGLVGGWAGPVGGGRTGAAAALARELVRRACAEKN